MMPALRSLGDVSGHEFHGNQYSQSKGTDKETNKQIVQAAGIKIKAPDHLIDAAHEAVAHVVENKNLAAAMKGKTVEVKPMGAKHGHSTAHTLYVDSKDLEQHGPGFTASAVHHELQHDILTKQGVPSYQQENKVRYTSGMWAGIKYGSMATTNPKAAAGFRKAAVEQGIKMRAGMTGMTAQTAAVALFIAAMRVGSLRVATSRGADRPVHAAADKHLPKLQVAVLAAFNIGRKTWRRTQNASLTAQAVRKALGQTLQPALMAAMASGGRTALGELRSAGDVAGHEFHGNQWTSGGGRITSGSDESYKELDKGLKQITDRISQLEEEGNDNPDNHEYAALTHISTAISTQLDAPLSQRQFIRSAYARDKEGNIVAAGVVRISKDKKSAEVLNLGSTTRGAGQHVLDLLHAQLKLSGIKNVTLTSTARRFYERAGYKAEEGSSKMVRSLAPQRAGHPHSTTGPVNLAFNVNDPAAIAWAKEHAAELAKDLSDTTESDIKSAVAAGMESGDYDEMSDAILSAVGDEARAEMIARTESMFAANEGQQQGWNQAVDAGLLPDDATVEWIATDGCCDDCDALDGTTRPVNGEYDDADAGDGPPLHPNCRCTEGISG